jgi:hypothetical protein
MPVAVVLAVLCALVRLGADDAGHLGFYQGLQDHLDTLTDEIDVVSSAERVE